MNLDKEVKKYIVSRFMQGDENRLHDDESLFETGVIDSLGVLKLVSFLEERFGVQIQDEELIPENFETVNKIIGFMESKTGSPLGKV